MQQVEQNYGIYIFNMPICSAHKSYTPPLALLPVCCHKLMTLTCSNNSCNIETVKHKTVIDMYVQEHYFIDFKDPVTFTEQMATQLSSHT